MRDPLFRLADFDSALRLAKTAENNPNSVPVRLIVRRGLFYDVVPEEREAMIETYANFVDRLLDETTEGLRTKGLVGDALREQAGNLNSMKAMLYEMVKVYIDEFGPNSQQMIRRHNSVDKRVVELIDAFRDVLREATPIEIAKQVEVRAARALQLRKRSSEGEQKRSIDVDLKKTIYPCKHGDSSGFCWQCRDERDPHRNEA